MLKILGVMSQKWTAGALLQAAEILNKSLLLVSECFRIGISTKLGDSGP
jgi:hypothetical protein